MGLGETHIFNKLHITFKKLEKEQKTKTVREAWKWVRRREGDSKIKEQDWQGRSTEKKIGSSKGLTKQSNIWHENQVGRGEDIKHVEMKREPVTKVAETKSAVRAEHRQPYGRIYET